MRCAYIILAHRLPEQLLRLVRKLNDDTASFFIHIDKRTDAKSYGRMAGPLRTYRNVYFVERRECTWGDCGILKATIHGIQQILALDNQCDYAILLTGQDYPIKSNRQIQNVLRDSANLSFLEYFALPNARWQNENGGLDRLEYWHFNFRGRRLALRKRTQFKSHALEVMWSRLAEIFPIRRPLPEGIAMFGGSAYWCLTRECIGYVNEFVQRNRAFVNFFEHVLVPDEIFFQTVILNSPYGNRTTNDNLRYIVWSNSPHPGILRKQDFHRLMNSDKLFARKFDVTFDADVLDMIDRATV